MVGAVARLVLMVASLVLLAACGQAGSGTIVTEARTVDPFDRIDASEGIDVVVTVDPAGPTAITVVFDDNLLDKVVTRVEGSTLIVEFDGSVRTTGGGRFVEVALTDLVAVRASGGADVTASGVAVALSVDASGGSDVDLRTLSAESVEVDASGGADVTITASESVTGSASGGADVSVHGAPASVAIETSGGADVDLAP